MADSARSDGVLGGEKIFLRARREADVAVLQAELYDDVATRLRADTRPWVPLYSPLRRLTA